MHSSGQLWHFEPKRGRREPVQDDGGVGPKLHAHALEVNRAAAQQKWLIRRSQRHWCRQSRWAVSLRVKKCWWLYGIGHRGLPLDLWWSRNGPLRYESGRPL